MSEHTAVPLRSFLVVLALTVVCILNPLRLSAVFIGIEEGDVDHSAEVD